MSGMGGYGQKCKKMPKSLHLNAHVAQLHVAFHFYGGKTMLKFLLCKWP
jgi:hypothetical protein